MAKENMRLNIYMNPNIVARIDKYAEELGLSRSSAISVICYEYFRSEDATKAMGKMNEVNLFDILSNAIKDKDVKND